MVLALVHQLRRHSSVLLLSCYQGLVHTVHLAAGKKLLTL